MKSTIGNYVLVTLLAIATLGGVEGCASSRTRNRQVNKHTLENKVTNTSALIVTIEGLQPYSGSRCKELGKRIALEFQLSQSASSGNWSKHIKKIREAYSNRKPIILIGYSSGTEEVWHITRRCEREQIPIELVVYLDPTHKKKNSHSKKIPKNVKRVIVYRGEKSGWFGGRLLDNADLESTETTYKNYVAPANHTNVPRNSFIYQNLRSEVEHIVKDRTTYAAK